MVTIVRIKSGKLLVSPVFVFQINKELCVFRSLFRVANSKTNFQYFLFSSSIFSLSLQTANLKSIGNLTLDLPTKNLSFSEHLLHSLLRSVKMGECFERFKMGCLMGASVGTGIGLIFGTISAIGYTIYFF